MDDVKLLRLLRKNPSVGMEQLMNQYAGLVYAVVKWRLAGTCYVSTDIEDCVADVFSEFYIGLNGYDPNISSIKSYLCVMARYHATDVARKREKQRENLSLNDESSFIQIADDFDVEGEVTENEFRKNVLSAIKELGEPDTSIILRKYYFGESSKEIATALNLTVSNVDTRAHRALNKLQKMFGGRNI